MTFSSRKTTLTLLLAAFSISAHATNGMNMEGYGPVAAAMGGAGMAYDNGTAALMNNPATLALMPEGTRIDLAAGYLGPHVKANSEKSGGNAYFMPAFGIAHKKDDLVFGFGVFAQGGMGTEYSNSGFYRGLNDMMGNPIADPGLKNRSEVGVGRALLPIAWKANENLTLGGSIDYVWATMDMKMLLDGEKFAQMMGGNRRFGSVQTNISIPGFVRYGYFDFSDDSNFSGAAKGHGWAGKIGLTYKLSPQLTAGVSYHSKTNLSDLKADGARMSMELTSGAKIPMTGKITVKNFEWPDQYGFGFSYTPNDRWQLVADYKRIGWKEVMKQFSMRFDVDNGGGSMDMSMWQNWKNQHVLMLGAAYKVDQQLTLRGGINVANNPVPRSLTNPLFPAIIKNHLTGGIGYALTPKSSLDLAATYAPKVKVNSDFSGAVVSHAQTNAQIMYSMQF